MSDDRPVIAVIGASGSQGGSVVRALVARGNFRVRAVTRNPQSYTGPADEVVGADLGSPDSLGTAFAGAHGVFAVTNFWEPGSDEITHGSNAVDAAAKSGVRHFVWSTMPNVEEISGGVPPPSRCRWNGCQRCQRTRRSEYRSARSHRPTAPPAALR